MPKQSLKTVWLVGLAFAGLGFVATFLEEEITLRTKVSTKFGIDEKKKSNRTSNEAPHLALDNIDPARE